MAEKDSMLDGFMKGLGRKLGTRRKEVHQAIRRFNEELNKDEPATPTPAAPEATAPPPDPKAEDDAKPQAKP